MCDTGECLGHERSVCANFLECLIPELHSNCIQHLYDPIIINYKRILKCIFIIKFEIIIIYIRDVIVSSLFPWPTPRARKSGTFVSLVGDVTSPTTAVHYV